MRKILVFGNPYLDMDNIAFKVADILKKDTDVMKEGFEFENCYDLSQVISIDNFIILDAVSGIKKVELLGIDDLEANNIMSLHDFDLGFFLKLKKELGKLDVKIIGIPQHHDIKKAIEEVKERLKELNQD